MKLFSCLAVLIFCTQIHASSNVDEAPVPLLTFEQLNYLSPEARVEYFKEVRDTLAEFEQSVHNETKDAKQEARIQQLHEYLTAMIGALNPLAQASAEDAVIGNPCGPPKSGFKITSEGRCGKLMTDMDIKNGCRSFVGTDPDSPDKSMTYCEYKAPEAAKKATVVKDTAAAAAPAAAKVDPPTPPIKDTKVKADKTAVKAKVKKADQRPAVSPDNGQPTPPKDIPLAERRRVAVSKVDTSKCPSREKARAAFYHDRPVRCLMGGNISVYKNGHIQAGNCQPVLNFPSDQHPAVAPCHAGENMCNPFLYCGASKGKKFEPLCVKVSQDLLNTCESSTQPKCDPYTLNIPGLHEDWNKFIEEVNGLCKKGNSFQSFFCVECQKMKLRLAAAVPPSGPQNNMPLEILQTITRPFQQFFQPDNAEPVGVEREHSGR
jgi:hypothetical protein